jgi:alpha-beta hydrolase superfamily lysophospholipase
VAHGYDFWALDLRKYGRSLLPHQHPNACLDINDYYEEIGMALKAMQAAGAQQITLLGHSTGGLIACLYAREGAERAALSRLVLNSPFFEFNESPFVRGAAGVMANALAGSRPYAKLPKGISPMYGESLHKSRRGAWEYNLAWKPLKGFPAYLGWVRTIRAAQQRLQQGLDLQIPILLLHSDKSVKAGSKWDEALHTADAVLNVEDMKKYGPGLGRNVTLIEIADGKHDLFLSNKAVCARALAAMFGWMEQGGA